MTIVTAGEFTLVDVNDGLNAFLTQEACLIATAADGSGGNFSIANTTMVVRQGTVDVSSQWTVTASPSAGVVGSLSVRTYAVSSMSVDTGFVDLTASKQGETPITLRFTITKARQGQIGNQGVRGSIVAARSITGSSWSDSEALAAIVAAGGTSPIRGDVVTLHNNATSWSQTRVRTTEGSWAVLAAFFGGDVLVNGTVVADKLAAGSVTSNKIAAGVVQAVHIASGSISASHLSVSDLSNFAGDSNMTDEAYWSPHLGTLSFLNGNTSWNSTRLLSIAAGGTDFAVARGRIFEVSPGSSFYLSYKARVVSGTGSGWVDLMVSANADMSSPSFVSSPAFSSGDIIQVDARLDIPAGARYARLRVVKSTSGATNLYFGDISLRRMNGGELIVDGTITSSKIATGAVNASKIEAGSILASRLAVSDTNNLYPDYDLQDAAFYTSSGPAISFGEANTALTGARELRIAGIGEAYSGWSMVETSAQVRARAVTRNTVASVDRVGAVFLELGTLGAGGLVTPTRRILVTQRSNVTNHIAQEVDVTLTTSEDRFRFVLVRSGSDTTNFVCMSGLRLRRRFGSEVIVDGAIQAQHVGTNEIIANTANIRDGVITNAKVADLSAAKLTAGTALASTITVNNTALGDVEARAADPAARVNLNTTLIDPGKIRVSGSTTLADWRRGGDETRIDGGAISANTIEANRLTIGSRGVTVTGVTFDFNSPGVNQVSWTSGFVRWINDAGVATFTSVSAGTGTWVAGVLYIYFDKTGVLKTSNVMATAFAANNLILATYQGGSNLITDYGRTIIDGNSIKTGTLTAQQMRTDVAIITTGLQIGNRIVDTNNLADEAATVAARVFVPGPFNITSHTTWVELARISIDREGYATDFDFSAKLDAIGNGTVQIGIFVGTTQLRDAGFVTGERGRQTQIAFSTTDLSTDTGITTYIIRAKKPEVVFATDPWIADVRLRNVFVRALHVKK